MSQDFLGDRKQALEEAFFKKAEKAQVDAYREKLARKAQRDQLRELSGMDDEGVLDALIELGVSAETMAALALVPLVHVAWADGVVQAAERKAILQAAGEKGIEEGSPAAALLAGWLEDEPGSDLFKAWREYIGALEPVLDAEHLATLKAEITAKAEEIARKAGGFLGIAAISEEEEEALGEIERAFPGS
jgi:hypothetical protein